MKNLLLTGLVTVVLGIGLVAQAPATTAATLVVAGAVKTTLTLTLADLGKMPRTTVTVSEDGTDVHYEGVLLAEILRRAGAPTGAALRGKALASYLLCEAKDGYRVVFALAEFDPEFNDNPIIVADARDGKPLFDYQGPFRIMAPRDKKAARGIRMLTKLTVVQLPD
jgi:hypothetical protein